MAGKAPKKDLGSCPYCGEALIQTKAGWGCSNFRGGCKAFIFKNDKFFDKVLGMKMTKAMALKLIMGGTVKLENIVIKGKQCSVNVSWGKKKEGPYEYGYNLEFINGKEGK